MGESSNSASTGAAVVITGVSTGIGAAAAQLLAARDIRVFGSVRRLEDAERLRQQLAAHAGNFTPLIFDITDAAAIQRAADTVRAALGGRRLLGLVNNAGIAMGGPLALQPLTEVRAQFEVNVLGALAATQAFLPLLGTDDSLVGPPGRIINISSVTGRIGPPFLGAYAGTKHALEGMSESLRRELLRFGIDVVIVAPGSIATPIWDKAEDAYRVGAYAAGEYAEPLRRFVQRVTRDGRRGLPAERVAEVVFRALTSPKPRVRYAVVPRPIVNWILPRVLPRRVVDRLLGSRLGLQRTGEQQRSAE
jgi:Short-chain dehydrogenases of various substrate specificities